MVEQRLGFLKDKIKSVGQIVRDTTPSLDQLNPSERSALERRSKRDYQATSSQGPVMTSEELKRFSGQ